jgi:hypothetical protein
VPDFDDKANQRGRKICKDLLKLNYCRASTALPSPSSDEQALRSLLNHALLVQAASLAPRPRAAFGKQGTESMADSIDTAGPQSAAVGALELRVAIATEEPSLPPLCLTIRGAGRTVPIMRSDVIVGRHSQADIRLPLPDVSRRHCRIVYAGGTWHVRDLNSLNGVYINGVRVTEAPLSHRDVITIGECELEVDMRSLAPTVLLSFVRPDEPLAA